MNQPELGKKIAELRKAKGFTQEELVEKCNLSVRTLQRIESGEVTPRSYTLKLIFTHLEYSTIESTEINKNEFFVFNWLEQFYKYVIDLFNLKTKTMKKISILTILFSGLFLIASAISKGKDSQVENIINNDSNKTSSELETSYDLVFSNFYCENCFEENNELIGHGVSFITNGVTIKMDLIKLNKVTREFNCGAIQGKLLENKVEVTCPKELANDESLTLSAEEVNKFEDKMVLKGKANIKSVEGDLIEADEIVIFYK